LLAIEEQQDRFREQTQRHRELSEQVAALEREKAANDKQLAIQEAAEKARQELTAQLEAFNRRRSYKWADSIILAIQVAAAIMFVVAGLNAWMNKGNRILDSGFF